MQTYLKLRASNLPFICVYVQYMLYRYFGPNINIHIQYMYNTSDACYSFAFLLSSNERIRILVCTKRFPNIAFLMTTYYSSFPYTNYVKNVRRQNVR